MEDIFVIVVFRTITKSIGQYIRYIFFRLIGKKKSWKSLSNESKDEYRDMGKALKQDFINAVVGAIVFFIVILIIVAIIFN